MRVQLLIAFLAIFSQNIFSQSIDSVSVAYCRYFYPPITEYGYTVDSFDTQHLKRNSWLYDSLWQPIQRTIYSYSNSEEPTHMMVEENQDTAWIVRRETFNIYDSQDSLIDNSWFYYYYSSGIITSTYGQKKSILRDTIDRSATTWNFNYIDSITTWDTTSIFISAFDSLFRINQEDFFYRGGSGNFQLTNTIEYFYLPTGSLDYTINSYSNSIDKIQNIYYPTGFIFQRVDSSWNFQSQQWNARKIEEYYYDSNYNVIAHSNNLIIDSLFSCLDTSSYQYDIFNNQIAYSFQSCDGGGNEGSFVLDSLQLLIHSHNCSWNHGDGYNCQDCDYTYYKGPFNQDILEKSQNVFSIFPNPAASFITLKGNWSMEENILIEIYNTLGVAIKFPLTKEKTELQVDISFLHPGLYFVMVTNSKGSFVQKLVLL